jgi:DNA-binding XRE family transcriptional regulator
MTHAYAETYLNDGMKNLGEAFDYAVNACKLTLDEFAKLFVASGYADKFGKGNPKTIAGLSGTELVMEVVQKVGLSIEFPDAQIDYDCSPEYWCGLILAYYQWATATSFRDILKNISMTEIYKLYSTHHEASEDKFVDTVNAIINRKNNSTKLQEQRKKCGYSQRELADMSGVNLRTLQQYELGSKDINKAQAQTVMALANALGCKIEDLLEPNTIDE